ncbi:extracellular solute-binding protein [Virgibacillus sp. MSJ-26]|uniref:sugar ABC transporter substrate-binding protein n=1 Tax=Virgibacillus sp. MSJ-26 TaxID=2841522 RepID=UPI001C10E870|nr:MULTISPECIES: extracellular solute-binding protein [unclassified Virgibacillus]MBU5465402.1 extracellular solute-binding protein [Virgibacillus sp. MSJ-26]HLR68333.1 extracellular solute-binding protein [Virgibacillus sp.]
MKVYIKQLGIYSIIALFFVLAACGPQEDSGEKAGGEQEGSKNSEYDLLVWEDVEKSEGIEDAIQKFEEENDVTIKVVEETYAQQIEKLRLDGPAGTGPDVLTMPNDQIGTAVIEGLIEELNVEEDITSIYTDVAMDSQIVEGKIYGLPKSVETTVLFYNKDIVSEDELPETLDDWYDLSKELTDGENFGLLALFDQIYYANSVLSGYGGYIFGEDENGDYDPSDIGLNNTGAIEGAELMQEFYTEKLFPSGIIGEQGIQVLDSLFSEGKAAAVISGPWNVEPFSDAGINYGVTKLPELSNGENMSSFNNVKSYNVSSYSENKELAERLVEFLANEENSKVRYEKTKEVPAVASLADDPAITENEAAEAVAEQSMYSEIMPGIPEMNSVWDPADAALETLATGKSSPEEALEQAVETIKGQIEANHGNDK